MFRLHHYMYVFFVLRSYQAGRYAKENCEVKKSFNFTIPISLQDAKIEGLGCDEIN